MGAPRARRTAVICSCTTTTAATLPSLVSRTTATRRTVPIARSKLKNRWNRSRPRTLEIFSLFQFFHRENFFTIFCCIFAERVFYKLEELDIFKFPKHTRYSEIISKNKQGSIRIKLWQTWYSDLKIFCFIYSGILFFVKNIINNFFSCLFLKWQCNISNYYICQKLLL